MAALPTWKNRNGRNMHNMHHAAGTPFKHAFDLVMRGSFTPDEVAPLLQASSYSAIYRLRPESYTEAEWHAIQLELMAAYQRLWEPSDVSAATARWEALVTQENRDCLQTLIDLEYPGMPKPPANEPLDAALFGVNGIGLQMATVIKLHAFGTDSGSGLANNIKTLRGRPWTMSSQCLDQVLPATWAVYHKFKVYSHLEQDGKESGDVEGVDGQDDAAPASKRSRTSDSSSRRLSDSEFLMGIKEVFQSVATADSKPVLTAALEWVQDAYNDNEEYQIDVATRLTEDQALRVMAVSESKRKRILEIFIQ
ncbi:hypothetical protein H9P43_006550 [Blastocladiella emersonii ATCC 22665]|nr:hypothetical protein H9P43_006550 [Blastocladiella emersonii ATCC 22665]